MLKKYLVFFCVSRICEDLGVKSPPQAYTPELPLISKMESDHEQYLHTHKIMPTPNSDGFYSGFPPCFTSLLSNCASDVEQGKRFFLVVNRKICFRFVMMIYIP